MSPHRQIIGLGWFVVGALIFSLIALNLGSLRAHLVIGGMLISLLYLVAGFALLANFHRPSWICLPCSAVSLFTFPIGTALGIYYLWYHFKIERVH